MSFGGGPDIQMPMGSPAEQAGYEPMTFEQHNMLLEKEAELANARDESQRQFMLEQEEMRMAQEEAQRVQIQAEEEAQIRETQKQEREAAQTPVTQDVIQEIEGDVDDVVANMYESLLGGVEASGEDNPNSEPLPE